MNPLRSSMLAFEQQMWSLRAMSCRGTTRRMHACSYKLSVGQENRNGTRFRLSTGRRNFSVRSTVEGILTTEMSWFKSLSESWPVATSQEFLEYVHDTSGLPWWASIICSTVLLRTAVTLPVAVYQAKIISKVDKIQKELQELVPELKRETAFAMKKFQWTPEQALAMYKRSLSKQWQQLIVRDNCHPLKGSILVLVQLPLWVCVSMAFRNMAFMMPHQDAAAQVVYLTLCAGGFGWMPNLTLPDSSLILPFIMALANLTIVECQLLLHEAKPTHKVKKWATNFHRLLSVVMIPIAASVPSCMCLYWTTSSVYGLVQNIFLMSPRVRRWFKIPQTSRDVQRPYRHIMEKLRLKIRRWGKEGE